MASVRSNHGPEAGDLRDLAAGNAAKRVDVAHRATEGVEVADNVLKDSSGANLANVSDQSISERDAARRALLDKIQ